MNTGASARIEFKIGDAFPTDDHVSEFMAAVSLARNDLAFLNMRLLGGNEHQPGQHGVSDGELGYIVRVSFAHLHELRECIRGARTAWPEVDAFLTGLPTDAQADLNTIMNLNTAQDEWIEPALHYLRHQTFHYGAQKNWKALRRAMQRAGSEDGAIAKVDSTHAGAQLEFADQIAVQHLALAATDHGTGGKLDQAVVEERLRTLITAVTEAVTASLRFGIRALNEYINGLPDGVVHWEHETDRPQVVPSAP